MTMIELIKDTAQQIIMIASSNQNGSNTWDEQPSAPEGGFTDRAGFVLISDIESYADVSLNSLGGLLRARIAKVTGGEDEEHFFIVTLHFSADTSSVKKVIEHHADITADKLIDVLSQESTVPNLVHVSYNTGRDSNGKHTGVRFEFSEEQIASLSDHEQTNLSKTLQSTFDSIMAQK